MKRVIIGVIIVIIVVVGIVLGLRGSSNSPATTSNTTTQTTNGTKQPAVNNAVLTTKTDPTLGKYLADPSGNPLYTFNADTKGMSNCTGSCLAEWPAYQDKGSTMNLPAGVSTIKRTDNGQIQFTFNGMPLYFFVKDRDGQATGNGVDNFSIAKPAATSVSQQSPASSMTSSSPSSSPRNPY